jgi:hypothetical protein
MYYRALLALPLLVLIPGVALARNHTQSYVFVLPHKGKPGSAFYVRGAGFRPGAHVVLTMACPNALHADQGRYETVPGPIINAHGRFAHFRMHAFTPSTLTAPITCTVYASVPRSMFGPDIKGHYLLIPPTHQR